MSEPRREPRGGLNRGSRLLLGSVLCTNIGLGGHTLATGVLLYATTSSAMAFASTLGVGFALGLLGQFFGGGVLDRGSPRFIDVSINVSRGVLVLLAALVAAELHSSVLVVVSFIYMSVLGPVLRANSLAITRWVAGSADLTRVNALRSGFLQVGQLVGLGLVSLLLTFVPPVVAFATNGIWFILGGLCVLLIRDLPRREAGRALSYARPAAALREWKEVIGAARQVPSIYVHFVVASSGPVIAALINLYIVPLNKAFGDSSLGLALLDGGFATGAIVASVALSRAHGLESSPERPINLSVAAMGAALLGLGLVDHLAAASLCTFIVGAASTVTFVLLSILLQLRSAQEVLGRVAVIQDAVASVVALVLVPVIGKIVDLQGVKAAVLAGSAVAAAYLVVALVAGSRHVFGRDLYTAGLRPETR